jgi:ketosteroid isomerase-like protein
MARSETERTVRALFDAFAARDLERSTLLLHPEVELWAELTAELTDRREPYRGHAGYGEYLADVDRAWASLDADPRDIRVAGPGVVVFGSATGVPRGSDEPRTLPLSWVFRMRDGLVVYARVARA